MGTGEVEFTSWKLHLWSPDRLSASAAATLAAVPPHIIQAVSLIVSPPRRGLFTFLGVIISVSSQF